MIDFNGVICANHLNLKAKGEMLFSKGSSTIILSQVLIKKLFNVTHVIDEQPETPLGRKTNFLPGLLQEKDLFCLSLFAQEVLNFLDKEIKK